MNKHFLYYLAPIFKFLIFALFLIMWTFPFLLISQFNFIQLKVDSLAMDLYFEVVLILVVLGALLMIFHVLWLRFENVFIVRKDMLPGFLKGSLIGFLLILGCSGLAFLSGNVVFSLTKINLLMVLGYALLYILVAIAEELLFRSFPLFIFAESYPVPVAILISSVFFGLAHMGNPDFTWLAMLNITLAGVLLSIFILQQKNISWAIGIHFAWNFTQGVLLGYNVSGTDSPGILLAKPIGSVYLSGGKFGIEGSIFCTGLMLIIITFMLVRYRIEPLAMTEEKEVEIDNRNGE